MRGRPCTAPVIHAPPSELFQATPSPNPPFPPEPQPALRGNKWLKRLWGLDMQSSGPTVSWLNLWLICSFLSSLSFLFRKMGGWIQSSLWPVTLRGEGLEP